MRALRGWVQEPVGLGHVRIVPMRLVVDWPVLRLLSIVLIIRVVSLTCVLRSISIWGIEHRDLRFGLPQEPSGAPRLDDPLPLPNVLIPIFDKTVNYQAL